MNKTGIFDRKVKRYKKIQSIKIKYNGVGFINQ